MQNSFEIHPGKGIGELRFGHSREKVIDILGEPDEREVGDDGDELEYFHYDDLALSLTFDGVEDWKLATIICAHEDLKLYEEPVFDLDADTLIKILKSKGEKNVDRVELSDDGIDMESVEAGDLEMLFWYEGSTMMEVQWGPLFADEDEIIWPA